jgi:hypothetical protein
MSRFDEHKGEQAAFAGYIKETRAGCSIEKLSQQLKPSTVTEVSAPLRLQSMFFVHGRGEERSVEMRYGGVEARKGAADL